MTIKFKDIEKGKVVLIDKLYGVKISDTVLLVKNSGANGTIEVESKEGCGSMFTVTLPISLRNDRQEAL